MAEVITKTTTTTTKTVTIDLGRNVVWKVDKVELTEKYSYWWSKPQLKQFRQDYQNEAMLEGVKNLVRAKIQKDFDDPDVVEERVEKIMKLEPSDIADFLQAGAKANAKAKGKGKANSNTALKDSNNNNNNNISNPPVRKAQRVADHRICELLGTCNCPVKQKITPKAPWMATTEPESESDSDDNDDSSSSSSSDDDTDDDDSSSSSSSSSDDDDTDDDEDDTNDEDDHEEDDGSTEMPKNDIDSYSLPEPEFQWEVPVQPSVPYSSVFDDDDNDDNDNDSNSLTTSDLDGNDEIIAGEGTQTKTSGAYMDDIDAIRRKFRRGALAVLAMEKLKRMVKTQSEPQQQQQEQEQDQPQAMWSSSSRLLDMYTASDDEESDDEKGNEKEETPETKIDQDQEQYPTTSEHEHPTRSTDSGNKDNESDSDSDGDSDDVRGDKEMHPSTTSEKERGSDNHNVSRNDNIDDDEDDSDDDNDNDNDGDNGSPSSSSRDDDTEEQLANDAENCPVCRGLVDPSYQKRRVILLRQTLCKQCFRAHYLDDTDTETETETETETDTESSKKTTIARRKKPLRLGKYEHIERNTKRDLRILRSLAKD
eukprot:CAMPEP_0172359284 /NCGR_PEP_ID=MMETSP1060-20121228/3490_1 /TAXON_ID=37318 /ORGANISM="Pseudo-nitzschia pungens, Strain cf. cingulata" /LENGTH=593 /DNA_ID=CAMNT_0013080861 /DNA_START=262 /DNA_END=2043 /DNA_ORIENTATION=-